MAKKLAKTATFDDTRALEVLSSPFRIELLQSFGHDRRLTVAELAERMGKPAASLYYHIRLLADVGVLVEVDRQRKGRRYESIYEVAAERIAIAADPSAEAQKDAITRLVASMCRKAARDFEAALEADAVTGREMSQVGRRQKAWLTDEDLDKIDALLDRIEKICGKRKPGTEGARPYSLLSLIVPLNEE